MITYATLTATQEVISWVQKSRRRWWQRRQGW
jgi:hypothetical protein